MSYRPWMLALVIAATLGVVAASSGPAWAQVKPPADFKFETGKDSPGSVTFSHEEHKTKVEKCTACHVKVFKMKKGQTGPLTMAKIKSGEQCGACHNGKTEVGGKVVFAADDQTHCEKCHKK
jgi:c(7)-type cytochrome triheme protein